MYTKEQDKPEGAYWKCTNDKCGVYWESFFRLCNLCCSELKAIVIKEDNTESKAR